MLGNNTKTRILKTLWNNDRLEFNLKQGYFPNFEETYLLAWYVKARNIILQNTLFSANNSRENIWSKAWFLTHFGAFVQLSHTDFERIFGI